MAGTSQHGKAFIRPKAKAHLLIVEARFHDDLADALLDGDESDEVAIELHGAVEGHRAAPHLRVPGQRHLAHHRHAQREIQRARHLEVLRQGQALVEPAHVGKARGHREGPEDRGDPAL